MKKRIRIHGILIAIAVIATFLFYRGLLPNRQDENLYGFLNTLGIGLIAAGFLLRVIARGQKAQHSANSKNLVTGGVYALTRNPMYLGTFLIGIGVSLAVFVWWVGFIFCVLYLSIYLREMKKEEMILIQRFGEAYKDYCRATPTFFPRLSPFFKKETRKYLFLKMPWFKSEFPSLISLIAVIILTKAWQGFRLFGRVDYRQALSDIFLIPVYLGIGIFFLCGEESAAEKF